MKNAKGILLSFLLIILITAFGLAPFNGAIGENVTSGNATNSTDGGELNDSECININVGNIKDVPLPRGDSSTTWTVHPTDPRANFTTIQAAIDNSSVANGDSIEVWNGTYNETVVDKRLTIYSRDGADVTIVNASGSGSAITIKADGCTVDGFKVTGSGGYPGDAGIKVESSGNIIVNNTCCENNRDGILLSGSSNNMISNNTCSENTLVGINLMTSSNNTISKNIGDNNWFGISLSDSSDNTILNNKISKNSQSGIYLITSSNNKISNNSCYENNLEGIYLDSSLNNILLNNDIGYNNQYGIQLVASTKNKLFNNEISNNSPAGIYLMDSSSNLIYRNDFVNNSGGSVGSDSSDNLWNSSSKITYTYTGNQYTNYTGNYWSDYTEADNNNDGIGDVPYDINEELGEGTEDDCDYYPLIQPFKFYIVENEPPVADFSFSPSEPFVNESVTFDASLSYDFDGVIISYQWDFGDGNITNINKSIITHYYRSAGDYTVKLTVTDNASATGSMSKVITIRLPVHNLNTSENFSTIQDAIYAVNTTARHIIEVDPGTYPENVKVNKSLTIRSTSGNPADTIVNAANPNNHVFEVIADYVNISGFTIKGATEKDKAGVYLNGVGFCNISNDNITNSYYGIYLFNSANNTITVNTFSNSTPWDIYLIDSEGNSFTDNTLSSYPTTITFTYAGDIALRGVRSPPADLSGYRNISKYVNATNITANPWLLLNISYTNMDLKGVAETTLKMYKYNGSDWELVSGENGVDITGKYVYANITSFSIFAPLSEPLPPVHNLNTSENFSTIQEAIYAPNTTDGHILEVRPGTYTENVKVNKSLTIRSALGDPTNTIVQAANPNDHVFNITANYVNISGFTVQGGTGYMISGINLYYSSNNTISNNNANSNFIGIAFSGSIENTISNNYANSNSYAGIAFFESSDKNTIANNTANNNIHPTNPNWGFGLIFYPFTGGSFNTITNNHFDNNTVGIPLYGMFGPSDNNVIFNNSVTFNKFGGMWIVDSRNNTIENNDFSHTQQGNGIELGGISSNNTLNNNVANSNRACGIYLWQSSNNNTITNNTVSSNKYHGIQITDSASYNTITSNNASFNSVSGIALFQSCSNNNISNNDLFSNLIGLSLIGDPSNNQIMNNTISLSKSYGIWLADLQYPNVIFNNTASNNNLFGIFVINSINNSISYNTANLNERGIGLDEASEIQLINNVANSNEISGFSLINSTNNTIFNNSASLNLYEGIYLSNSSRNNISNNNVSSSYFGISLYSSNDNDIINNIAESTYYFKVFLYSSTGNNIVNFTKEDIHNQTDIIRGVRLYVPESLTPSLQSVDNTTNATYYIIVENLGVLPDTFNLSNSSIDNPEVLSLDQYNITLGTGETSARILADEFETIKLNVSDTEPGIYRVKVEVISRNDTVKDGIETRTIVQGVVGPAPIKSTIINSALINSSINNAIITKSAIINSIISDSTITNSIITNSEVVGTSLSDVILEDAIVNNGFISSGDITINGITYKIKNEARISDLVIGSDYRDSNLVGIKYIKTLILDAENSNTCFDISAKDDYFAGSMRVQKSMIPPNGIPEFTNNVGGYVYANASDNLANSTGWLIIKVFYDPNELGELDESLLKLRYFNETADPPGWEDIPSEVNLTGKYVWGKISHYSVFAVSGAVTPKVPPGGPGGGRPPEDSDGDGLTDLQELILGTGQNNPDTDGDGFKDGEDPFPLDPNLPLRLTPTPTPTPRATPTATPVQAPTTTPLPTPTPVPVPAAIVPVIPLFVIIIAIVAAVIIVSVAYLVLRRRP